MAESHDHVSCQEVVEQHLNFCEGCVWYVEQIKNTVDAVGEVRAEDISPEAKERLMTAFRDWRGS